MDADAVRSIVEENRAHGDKALTVRTVSGDQWVGEARYSGRLGHNYISIVSPPHFSIKRHTRVAIEHVESISYDLEGSVY